MLPFLVPLVAGQTTSAFGGHDPVRGKPWHHADMTFQAALASGWSARPFALGDEVDHETMEQARGSAAYALSWHVDYLDSYLYNPLWWAAGGSDRFRHALRLREPLAKLHFDELTSTKQITLMWDRYLGGTVAGLLWAASRDDVHAARNVVGAGLHALQDFYSHTNWVDDPARRPAPDWSQEPKTRLESRTWFGFGQGIAVTSEDPRESLHLYSGTYEHENSQGFKPHGKYALDCLLMRKFLPKGIADVIFSAWSPLGDSAMARRWRECQSAVVAQPETIAGMEPPAGLLYLQPPGIALDNIAMAQIALGTPAEPGKRDLLPSRAALTAKQLFDAAKTLAEAHTGQWLACLDLTMADLGLGGFWTRVKTAPREGEQVFPVDAELAAELAAMVVSYRADLREYEDPGLAPFGFLAAGTYPPGPDGADEGWYLRVELATADEHEAGTDADIVLEAGGRRELLDLGPQRTPGGGLDELRLLAHNDFERGARTAYYVGPYADLPSQLTLRNQAADTGDLVQAWWDDTVRIGRDLLRKAEETLLSILGGNADFVGSTQKTWDWNTLSAIARSHPEPIRLEFRGGSAEGDFDVTGNLVVEASGDDLRATLNLAQIICLRPASHDTGPSPTHAEPFVVLYLHAPGSAQGRAHRSSPPAAFEQTWTWVEKVLRNPFTGKVITRFKERIPGLRFPGLQKGQALDITASVGPVQVPRFTGLLLPAQMWESDAEDERARNEIRDTLARGYSQDDINRRSKFLDDAGRMIAPAWKIASVDVVAFKRGTTVQWAQLARDRRLDAWLYAGRHIDVPLDRVQPTSVTLRLPVSTPTGPGGALAVPELLTPAEGQEFPERVPRVTTLTWRPVPGATAYLVEVSAGQSGPDSQWTDPTSATVTQTSHTFNFVGAQPGRWRVRAIGAQGDSSAPSPWRRFAYVPTSPQPATPADCLSYDPRSLRIVNEGEAGWLLTDGRSRMAMLDTEADARKALALAQRHTAQCFIGRGNRRPNRRDYIVTYWTGVSGITTTISQQDCIPYDVTGLRIANEGAAGWLLTDGRSRMLTLDSEADARQALALARQHTAQCFIGRGNRRPDRQAYIMAYWR